MIQRSIWKLGGSRVQDFDKVTAVNTPPSPKSPTSQRTPTTNQRTDEPTNQRTNEPTNSDNEPKEDDNTATTNQRTEPPKPISLTVGRSLTHARTRSPSLTHYHSAPPPSLTHSPTHSLTHSLTACHSQSQCARCTLIDLLA